MRPLRRREAIAAGAAAPLALAVPALAAGPNRKKQQAQAALLAVLRLEQTAVVAYEAIANTGTLSPRLTALLRQFRDQDTRHAQVLAMALDKQGVPAPIPPRRADIPGLTEIHDDRAAAGYAAALEERTIAAYLTVVQLVTDSNLLKTSAGAMGTDGQQLVVLRELLGVDPVPAAFERGSQR